jgi:hypothetical protein
MAWRFFFLKKMQSVLDSKFLFQWVTIEVTEGMVLVAGSI